MNWVGYFIADGAGDDRPAVKRASPLSPFRGARVCATAMGSRQRGHCTASDRVGASLASRHASALTYPSPVSPVSYRSCNRPWPGGVASPRGPTPFPPKGCRDYGTARATPSGDDVDASPQSSWGQALRTERRPPVKLRAGSTDRVDKAWTSARHLTTPSPHSALSRPRPHRLDNNRS